MQKIKIFFLSTHYISLSITFLILLMHGSLFGQVFDGGGGLEFSSEQRDRQLEWINKHKEKNANSESVMSIPIHFYVIHDSDGTPPPSTSVN